MKFQVFFSACRHEKATDQSRLDFRNKNKIKFKITHKKAGVLNGTSLLNGNMEKPDFQIESVESQSTQHQPTQLNGSHTPLTMGDLPVNLLKTAADEQEAFSYDSYDMKCSQTPNGLLRA